MEKHFFLLQRVRERQWNKKNKLRVSASYQEGDWVLVHHSRLPATFDFTGHKVANTRILCKWFTKLTHLCCVLRLF